MRYNVQFLEFNVLAEFRLSHELVTKKIEAMNIGRKVIILVSNQKIYIILQLI